MRKIALHAVPYMFVCFLLYFIRHSIEWGKGTTYVYPYLRVLELGEYEKDFFSRLKKVPYIHSSPAKITSVIVLTKASSLIFSL